MPNKPRLVIANMYRAKNKAAFFAIHQAITRFHEADVEFHILWDDNDYKDEWTEKINNLNCTIISYTKEQLINYCIDQGIKDEQIKKFTNFKAIYFVIHGHYLRKNNITDYYLIYDDDIILREELDELKNCLYNKIPCLIYEPLNAACDKVLLNHLLSLYPGGKERYLQINPSLLGFNAGFQGMRLEMYDDFLEPEYFSFLINLFDYRGIYDDDGKEITGNLRHFIDTQQQSFFSCMSILRSTIAPHILNIEEYFVCTNWGVHPTYGELNPENEYEGWDINLKSKVVHFIGHSELDGVYYGKPKIFNQLVDEYLTEQDLI